MTTPITKEQLTDKQVARWLADAESVMTSGYIFSEEYAAARAIFELASEVQERRKAAMDAEPIYQVWDDGKWCDYEERLWRELYDEHSANMFRIVYAAPPAPVVPDGWIACNERMPDRDYVLAADFSGKQYPANMPNIQIGIYADWFDDGSPCWDDGDGNDLHLKQVTHWTQIPAAPQQEGK